MKYGRYAIGTAVKVKEDLIPLKIYNGVQLAESTSRYRGVISRIEGYSSFGYRLVGIRGHFFTEEMLEIINNKKVCKFMNKCSN